MAFLVIGNEELAAIMHATNVVTPNQNWDWPQITGISSLFISCLALGATIWQGVIARSHNVKSTDPVLDLVYDYSTDEALTLYLRNSGNGPAIIGDMAFDLAGALFPFDDKQMSLQQLLPRLGMPVDWRAGGPLELSMTGVTPGVSWVVPPLGRQPLFCVKYAQNDNARFAEFKENLKHIRLVFTYSSIYKRNQKFDHPLA